MNYAEMMKQNRTIRKFRQKTIPAENLSEICENLRYVHCGNNRQVLRYMLITDPEYKKKVEHAVHYAAALPPEIGMPKEDEVPDAYIAILLPEEHSSIQEIDTGIAAQVITASACTKGIASCMIANFNAKELTEALDTPKGMMVRLVISLGYPALCSKTEDVVDGNLSYSVDEDGNYHVPKLSVEELFLKR